MVPAKEVHSAAYPGDGFLEEEQTIEERIAPPRKSLDASALHQPISILPYVSPPSAVDSCFKRRGCPLSRGFPFPRK